VNGSIMLDPDSSKLESEMSLSMVVIGSEGLHEFIRYALASAVALCCDTGLLWLGTSVLGFPYLLSGAISFVAGLSVVYCLSIYWVFSNRWLLNPRYEFLVFASIGSVGLILNEVILYIFTEAFGFFYMLSKLGSIAAVFGWNFVMRKVILFPSRP
jgi:putative flippase GtrA